MGCSRRCCLYGGLVVATAVTVLAVAAMLSFMMFADPWKAIENPNGDAAVVEIAKFAVKEYNNKVYKEEKLKRPVVFVSVIEGRCKKMVFEDNANYRLFISTDNGLYFATIGVRSFFGHRFKFLHTFKK